jgi:hypothetical protein
MVSPHGCAIRACRRRCSRAARARAWYEAPLRLAPEAAGLLAASPGLSPMFAEDLPQLEAGMLRYDAFYRRDGR